jgi:predicted glycosyltransferase involved in capsule biosynthesis
MTAIEKEPIILSLLVPYRNRPLHLKCLLEWFVIASLANARIELVIIEYSLRPSMRPVARPNIRYVHVEGNGVFNKARLLNMAFKISKGKIVVAYDVDLVPADLSFDLHLSFVEKSETLLFSGYRLNYPEEYLSPADITTAKYLSAVAKENCSEKFLKMQLVDGQRFGVLPFFNRRRVMEIGGWDERFEGWGGEDQDFIERYLGNSRYLVKCPDLLYIHLHHGHASGWNDPLLTERNTALYQQKRTGKR